jgi:hypothetical protein
MTLRAHWIRSAMSRSNATVLSATQQRWLAPTWLPQMIGMKSIVLIALSVALLACIPSLLWAAGGDTAGAPITTVIHPPPLLALDSNLAKKLQLGFLLQHDAAELVDATVCKCSGDSQTYVLIQVVSWVPSGTAMNGNSKWYIFRGAGKLSPWTKEDFSARNRLYGAKHTYLLSIQVVPSGYQAQAPTYVYTESKRVPTNIQDLASLLEGVAGKSGGARVASGTVYFETELPRAYSTADISIQSSFPKAILKATAIQTGEPGAPVQNPPSAQPPGEETTPENPVTPPAPTGGGPQEPAGGNSVASPPVPPPLVPGKGAGDKTTVNPIGGDSTVTMAEYSVTDETKAWWDASVAVPVSKISDVQYSSTNDTVTPKTVNRQSVFAVADFFIPRKDLVNMQYSLIPHPLVGVSMASKPLQSLLFGGAIGFSFGEVYFGANLLKQQSVGNGLAPGSTATPGELAASTRSGFNTHFSVGINLSVKSAFAAINKSKSN